MTLQQAIAKQEGFGLPKTLATLNHNPGNIIEGRYSRLHGSTGSIHGYAVFPDDAAGWAALTALLAGPVYRTMTVAQVIHRYCPASDGSALTKGNDPDSYMQHVCGWLGVKPETPISGLLA